jgi:hypothetical protein
MGNEPALCCLPAKQVLRKMGKWALLARLDLEQMLLQKTHHMYVNHLFF